MAVQVQDAVLSERKARIPVYACGFPHSGYLLLLNKRQWPSLRAQIFVIPATGDMDSVVPCCSTCEIVQISSSIYNTDKLS